LLNLSRAPFEKLPSVLFAQILCRRIRDFTFSAIKKRPVVNRPLNVSVKKPELVGV